MCLIVSGDSTAQTSLLPHQRNQQQHFLSNPDLHTMNTWAHQPGTVNALEALLRGGSFGLRTSSALKIMIPTVRLLSVASASQDPTILPACISLAATVQKMLYRSTHVQFPNPSASRRQERRQALDVDDPENVSSLESAQFLIEALLHGIMTLDRATDLFPPGSPGLSNYRNSSLDEVTGSRESQGDNSPSEHARLFAETHILSGVGNQISACGVVLYPFASRRALLGYQLQVVLLASLVPLCHLRVFSGEEDPVPWLSKVSQEIGSLKSRLAAVGTMLLSERVFSSIVGEKLVQLSLERFGSAVFRGRIVPGCCNLGCENLQGPSEASVRTWLCAGCRRARYCSLECQRNAWDSHRNVCGRLVVKGGSFLP